LNKKIIIIAGSLASGKSTFAKRLSRAVNVPCLIKDDFKSALCASVAIGGREESSRFSAVTFDGMMYVAGRLFEVGSPVIIEGNFVPAGVKKVDEAGAIRRLIGEYGYTPLTFKFAGDTEVLHKRFLEREKTLERGRANKIGSDVPYEAFDQWCRNFGRFDVGGETVQVDATDFAKVDFNAHIETVKQFLR